MNIKDLKIGQSIVISEFDFNEKEKELIEKMKKFEKENKTLIVNIKSSVFKKLCPNLYKLIDTKLLTRTGAVKLKNKDILK